MLNIDIQDIVFVSAGQGLVTGTVENIFVREGVIHYEASVLTSSDPEVSAPPMKKKKSVAIQTHVSIIRFPEDMVIDVLKRRSVHAI